MARGARGNRCCEACCCCCCHGNINLVSVMGHLGGWMISIGIITCVFGFTALADAKNVDVFKVTAMLLCGLGLPTSLGAFYVDKRVRKLTDGDPTYLRTRDALFDVFVCTGAILMLLGFIFMTIGFTVQSKNVVLAYIGVMGTVQFVVGMLGLVFIRVWVRGSQPRTGRGNLLDVILDLKYPVVMFETTVYEHDPSQPPEAEVYEQEPAEPTLIINNLPEVMQYRNGALRVMYLPSAPPTYEMAVTSATDDAEPDETNTVQFELPPPYHSSTSS